LLGIGLGTYSVSVLLGVSSLVSGAVLSQLATVSGNSVFAQQSVSNRGPSSTRLSQTDVDALSGLYGITVVPQVFETVQYDDGQRQRAVTLNGSPGDTPRLDPTVHVQTGRFYSRMEAQSGEAVAVLNNRAASDLYGKRDPIGQSLALHYPNGTRITLTVIGVLQPVPGIFQSLSTPQVMVPNPYIWRVSPVTRKNDFDIVQLVLAAQLDADTVADRIQGRLDALHGKEMFTVQSSAVFRSVVEGVGRILQLFFGVSGSLALVVGGIGIMNVMLASVTERTRDIGLLMALGATPAFINRQFIFEAFILSCLGGGLGLIAAQLTLWGVSILVPLLGPFTVQFGVVAAALGISMFCGLFFGV